MSVVNLPIAFQRFANRALDDDELELEIGLDLPISPPMFRRLVKTLRIDLGAPIDTLQMNISRGTSRFEWHGRESIEAALKASARSPAIGPGAVPPSVVLCKSLEMPKVPDEMFPYTIHLKREKDCTSGMAETARGIEASEYLRIKRRFSFRAGMCKVDCTVVQTREADFKSESTSPAFTYEVEIELVDRKRKGSHASLAEADAVVAEMTEWAHRCLCVMLGTSEPLTKKDRDSVLSSIAETVRSVCPNVRRASERLVGPQPVTLMRAHVQPPRLAVSSAGATDDLVADAPPADGRDAAGPTKPPDASTMRDPSDPKTSECASAHDPANGSESVWSGAYTVTDKADGTRCQLFVLGRSAYTLDASMAVRRVADDVPEAADGSWIDGELITHNAPPSDGGEPSHMNLFAAFDIYRSGRRPTIGLPLVGPRGEHSESTRLGQLDRVVQMISRGVPLDGFAVDTKRFRMVDQAGRATREVLEHARFVQPYATDGLIFTPAFLAVGAEFEGAAPNVDHTWARVLKWKPVHSNTIDFLVRTSASGKSGPASRAHESVITVDTEDGPRSVPCHVFDLFASYVPREWEKLDVAKYIQFGDRAFPSSTAKPRRFKVSGGPGGDSTDERDPSRMYVRLDAMGRPTCADGDQIYGDTIVECAYGPRGWYPLRLRPEKTARLSRGIAGAANAWGTALGVWESLCEPVTDAMIMRLADAPAPQVKGLVATDTYYKRRDAARSESSLFRMNTFHNQTIKATLYRDAEAMCEASGPPALFEFACGKGGDISRWLEGSFTPIVGIDLSMDNIVNASDGIYARIASARNRTAFSNRMVAFVCMNAQTNMRPPLDEIRFAAANSPHGDVISTLWDTSKKAISTTAYAPLRGLALRGFDVVSCQFAIHYMFENDLSLDHFARNVAFLMRPGAVFIGTCFDGDRLARALQSGTGSLRGCLGSQLSWQIDKRYEGVFDGGTGAAISVYVETIGGDPETEYLVSPRLLKARLKAVGLECEYIRPFSDKFADERAAAMTATEREFSSFSMMFLFKRVVDIAAK